MFAILLDSACSSNNKKKKKRDFKRKSVYDSIFSLSSLQHEKRKKRVVLSIKEGGERKICSATVICEGKKRRGENMREIIKA